MPRGLRVTKARVGIISPHPLRSGARQPGEMTSDGHPFRFVLAIAGAPQTSLLPQADRKVDESRCRQVAAFCCWVALLLDR